MSNKLTYAGNNDQFNSVFMGVDCCFKCCLGNLGWRLQWVITAAVLDIGRGHKVYEKNVA